VLRIFDQVQILLDWLVPAGKVRHPFFKGIREDL